MSVISLIGNASLTVQFIMALLGLFSITSWGIIFSKWRSISKAKSETQKFISQFYSTNSLTNLFNSVTPHLNAILQRKCFMPDSLNIIP